MKGAVMVDIERKVLEHFKSVLFSSAHACAEMCGLEHEQVVQVMQRLIRAGRLRQAQGLPGLYQYLAHRPGTKKTAQAPQEQRRLWWAINMPQNNPAPFSAFSLAQITGIDHEYAKRYIARLLAMRHIRVIGRQNFRALYRVAKGAPRPDEAPVVNINM